MDRDEVKAALRKLPVEASAAFAVRVGLRVLPWLAMAKDGRALARWPKQERSRHLLAVLQAYEVGLMAVWDRKALRLREVARARRAAAAPAVGADAPAVASAVAADAPAYASDMATYAAYAVVDAVYAAADAAAEAYAAAYLIVPEIELSVKNNLFLLRKNGKKALIHSPLWPNAAPAPWVQQLQRFQTAVRGLDAGFEIWLDWYDARCRGDAVDVAQLRQRVFLPDSVTNQSPQEINAYLASLISGQAAGPLNRVRTIFIGDGEAGKTSLIRVLNGEDVVEGIEAKTPGIAIRPWKVPGTDITASFWDFGGQVMVHATHQLFLRESCLYVLLVSAREKEKATERAEYWLEHVKSFGRGSPVLIVANKADKEPVQLDQSLLTSKYPGMIAGFFQLACTEAQGAFRNQFEQFKAAFCQQLQAVGLHQVLFEKAHFSVLQNLQQRTPKESFVSKIDYATLCREHKVDQQTVLDGNWLLKILDQLGVIVHFPDMADEMDEYILNPRWLTYGVYTIMYNEQPRITRKQAVELLCAKPVADQDGNVLTYPASKCRIVFDAMEKFKLCYFLPQDREQIIIPALLPSDIKPHRFDTASALEFHYQFESFLPRHVISELIVECHADIAMQDGEDIVWQHGVLLHNRVHNTDALVQADYHFRRLTIWLTRSAQVADFLAVLRDKVERIVSRIEISYERNIRLPRESLLVSGKNSTEAEWADFEQLLAMRNKNRPVYDHKSGSEYSISKILGLFEPPPASGSGRNTTIHIHDSHIEGDVTAAESIKGSFRGK